MAGNITYVGKHSLTMTVSRHSHTDWEIIYCTEGNGVLKSGGRVGESKDRELVYGENDILVIPPEVPHENSSDTGFCNYHIHMNVPLLSHGSPFTVTATDNVQILPAFSAAFYYYSKSDGTGEAMLNALGNVIATYISTKQQSESRSESVLEIEREIIQHYTDLDFDLGQYLKKLPFSEDYLTKLFKREMGTTPSKYLMDLRLRSAMDWLRISGDSSISEIASMCGFRDPLHFSRVFRKKYGVSPSNYRNGSEEGTVGTPEKED